MSADKQQEEYLVVAVAVTESDGIETKQMHSAGIITIGGLSGIKFVKD